MKQQVAGDAFLSVAVARQQLLTFAVCSPTVITCASGNHARFLLKVCPSVAPTNAAVTVGIGLEWNRVQSPKFVQPGCTATATIQVGEMLRHEGVEAYKKEGPKFMQRLVAKQKVGVKDS